MPTADVQSEQAHAMEERKLLTSLGARADAGLDAAQVEQARLKFGPNSWNIEQKTTALDILVRQVSNILMQADSQDHIGKPEVLHWRPRGK